jgi:hypothetical protein
MGEYDIGRRMVVCRHPDIGAEPIAVNGWLRESSDQAPQRFDVTDQDRRLTQIYQALAMPTLQNFIDALPTPAGHVAEFSLRDVKLHGGALQPVWASSLGELQQPFCESRLEMPKHHILDLFARLP